ncbi:MAG: hypothetical protein AAFQ33_06865 [Pseudomonadota bacterium]
MQRSFSRTAMIVAVCSCFLLLFPLSATAQSEKDRFVTGFVGMMTDDTWENAIQLWQTRFVRSGFVGIAYGQDVLSLGPLSLGYEGQVVQHFGEQDNLEANLPVVVRYHRDGTVLNALESVAFGLGVSVANEKPEGEVRRNGDSNAMLVYWMAEMQFDLPRTEVEGILRLHHRSDGYGLFPVDSGSNGFALGLRRRF